MHTIFTCFLRQFVNYWNSLYLRIKIEIFVLLIIFYSFISEKLVHVFSDLLTRPNITGLGLNSFSGHVIALLLSISMPFVYFKLLPRQESLRALRILPLSSNHALAALLVYITWYELISLIISGPVFIALLITSGPLPVSYYLYLLIVFPVTSLLLLQFLLRKSKSRTLVTLLYFISLSIYFSVHSFVYLHYDFYLIIDIFLFPGILILLYNLLKPFADHWDLPLSIMQSKEGVVQKVKHSLQYAQIPKIVPGKIHPFLAREILGHIRNKNYLRMKILSIVLFSIVLFFFGNIRPDFIAVICFIFCWWHYSHQFNNKYVFSESRDFLVSLPVQYYQIWFSKFLTEIILLLPILLISLLALLFFGDSGLHSIVIFMALVTFSVLLLFIITNIRLLFLDNARMAGYAYHFLVIFSLIMIGNFYLVGPIVILGLLVYLSFLSYRQFSR